MADDTSAVVQWHAAGTFTGGLFQGIAPTGRRSASATLARQIGLLPGLGSRADQALLAAFNAKTTLSQDL